MFSTHQQFFGHTTILCYNSLLGKRRKERKRRVLIDNLVRRSAAIVALCVSCVCCAVLRMREMNEIHEWIGEMDGWMDGEYIDIVL